MLAEILKEWRYAKRYSLREAAKKLGISHPTLSRIENGYSIGGETLMHLMIIFFKCDEENEGHQNENKS